MATSHKHSKVNFLCNFCCDLHQRASNYLISATCHKCSMLCDCNESLVIKLPSLSSVVDGIESLSDSTNKVFDQSSLFLNCNYYDTISLNSQILNRSNTNIFIHFNIRSLQKISINLHITFRNIINYQML